MDTQHTSFQEPRQNALLIATIVRCSPHPLPLARREENESYGHLATLCADRGIDLHLAHYDNLSNDLSNDLSNNACSEASALAWAWRAGSWQLVDLPLAEVSLCYADLPPNLLGANAFRHAIEAHPISVVNALRLSDLLTDKLATHTFFENHIPLTVSADGPDLVGRLQSARLHPDLSTEKLFLKPRYGERGRGISVTDLDELAAYPASAETDYILQAFLETGSGIPELGIDERHDLRLILCNGEIVLAFVRMPAAGSYVSNCSQGGREVPIDVEQLPARVRRFAFDIDAQLDPFGSRLYSLDLGIGRSGKIWIYELNTMPGIVWDDDLPENKPLHRSMHHILAAWLAAVSLEAPRQALVTDTSHPTVSERSAP